MFERARRPPASKDRAPTATPCKGCQVGSPCERSGVDRPSPSPRIHHDFGQIAVDAGEPAMLHRVAATGLTGAARDLPHLDAISGSFGRYGHQLRRARAYVGGPTAEVSRAMDAVAYTVGNEVGFAGMPSLFTAAHEAAHVIQQSAGVHLEGRVGRAGDPYERQADAVATAVVAGRSAEGLLGGGRTAPGSSGAPAIQRRGVRSLFESAVSAVSEAVRPTPATLVGEESFDGGARRTASRTVPVDYTRPVPGTVETTTDGKSQTSETAPESLSQSVKLIQTPTAFVVITGQSSVNYDSDNELPGPYRIDDRGRSVGRDGIDNIGTGWPRERAFVGEVTHVAPYQDIHSCVRCPDDAPPRIPIDRLTQHQIDYLQASGLVLGDAGADGIRRPRVQDGSLVVSHQLKFTDGTSPDSRAYNERVRNSSNSNAFPGMSVVTVNVQAGSSSFGVSGDSQGLYNLEGSAPQVAAAGSSNQGFISVYLHAPNALIDRSGRIQVTAAEFTQARIDATIGQQYQGWLSGGGDAVLERAKHIRDAQRSSR